MTAVARFFASVSNRTPPPVAATSFLRGLHTNPLDASIYSMLFAVKLSSSTSTTRIAEPLRHNGFRAHKR